MQGCRDDDDRNAVRNHVPHDNGGRFCSDCPCSKHVFLLLDGENLAPDLAGHTDPVKHSEYNKNRNHSRPEPQHDNALRLLHKAANDDRKQNNDEHIGQGVNDIDNTHHEEVDPAAEKARNRSVQNADDDDDDGSHHANGKRNTGAVNDPDGVVPPQGVCPHNVGKHFAAGLSNGLFLCRILKGVEVFA
ncbi:hypothetical protein SDC9_55469 [bioreactor metagenome]|uniref:Uncharacterized protein n=1 Tax=bioreactor metagenome TaxID=1076179 RepID=A0A644X4C2_9ZZZZ